MHIRKTGALIHASVALAPVWQRVERYAAESTDPFRKFIGLASRWWMMCSMRIQHRDCDLGKTAGKDARNNKPTYVSALGLERARDLAREFARRRLARARFAAESGGRLRQLADFIVSRKF